MGFIVIAAAEYDAIILYEERSRMPPCIIVSPFGVHPDSFPAGTHFIGEKVRIGPLSDEHKSRVVEYLDRVGEEALSRRVRRKPAFVVPHNELSSLRLIPHSAGKTDFALRLHQFALEYFATTRTPMVAFFFDGDHVSSHAFDPFDLRFPEHEEIPLQGPVWEKHATYLTFLYDQVHKAPLAQLAITRFCRAHRQGPSPDGIIDLAIGLECLVIAQLEVKFQFSLYHSLINVDSPDERAGVFSMLQKLYDVRSLTVHGGTPGRSDKPKMKYVQDNWMSFLKIARENLTYYIAYSGQDPSLKWQDHLRRLALGDARSTG